MPNSYPRDCIFCPHLTTIEDSYIPVHHEALNPNLPSGLFHSYLLDESISDFRGIWCIFFHFYFISSRNSCKQSLDPDQTPHFAVSDLGLHCIG